MNGIDLQFGKVTSHIPQMFYMLQKRAFINIVSFSRILTTTTINIIVSVDIFAVTNTVTSTGSYVKITRGDEGPSGRVAERGLKGGCKFADIFVNF